MSDVVTVSDFLAFCGNSTGSYTETQVQVGLDIAEWLAEEFLNTPLTPTQQTEEYPWPFQKELQLKKRRVITIDTVTALHFLDCQCSWTTTDECAISFNAEQGIIHAIACAAFPCCTARGRWCGCDCPARIRITYTAGFPLEYFTGKVGSVFDFAICQITKFLLEQTTTLFSTGEAFIKSWSSMDYSESKVEIPAWYKTISMDPRVIQSLNLLGILKKKRFLGIRGRGYP